MLMRHAENKGAYSARNTGLSIATGDLITVHDADDWAHPQKLYLQVGALKANTSKFANYTDWCRASSNLYFTGSHRPPGLVQANKSSTVLRKEIFKQYGGWDNVRISADNEFILRISKHSPDQHIPTILPSVPLSFALDADASLTRERVTHARTLSYGIRREYHESAAHWHTKSLPQQLRIDGQSRTRPFPVPGIILPRREARVECDILFIMDFNLGGGAFVSTMNYVEAALAQGLSPALFHWRRYDLDGTSPLKSEIRQMAQEGKLRIVAPGEKVSTSTVILGYPCLLQHVIDLCPQVKFSTFLVLVNQMAARLYGGGDVQYDPHVVRKNLQEVVRSGSKVGANIRVSPSAHEGRSRYPVPHFDTWMPLIDTAKWCAKPLHWRGRERQRPVIGRHGRDHYTKWPAAPDNLTAAYCANRPCDVRILGGAKRALGVIGKKPLNWTIHEFGAMDVRSFLSDLDFFIHYPHEDYIEEFGRSVIEAMAVGCPAILPPRFKLTFGSAAIYAEPTEVWECIRALWQDENAYLSRARAGRDFALANSDWKHLAGRLERLASNDHFTRP